MTCIFDLIVKKEMPATILDENDHALVIMDIHPQAPYHELVMPKKHYTTVALFLKNASAEEKTDFDQLISKRILHHDDLNRAYKIMNHNGRQAGQEIDHMHYHILSWDTK
jgi:histidine triad (HIT) family protein